MEDSADAAVPALRLAVLGDLDGIHTQRWLGFFAARGHELHAISFYPPSTPCPASVTVHVLRQRPPGKAPAADAAQPRLAALRRLLPPSFERLVQYNRYARAGLARVVTEIDPDVFQAHFVVEHGFYGTAARFHPYVVSAWGSDIFLAPRSPLGREIAKWALKSADLVTVNDPEMGRRVVGLGVAPERVALVRLGVDPDFLAEPPRSVNHGDVSPEPTFISDRALEPLYNVDAVIEAFARARSKAPDARLLIANDGRERRSLAALVHRLGLTA
jgi:glycosyltransferase involved in cell wall biosynthesis